MLRTRVGELELDSPLLTASGTFGHDPGALAFLRPGDLGAFVLKTVTPRPRKGNPAPRITETPAGILNSIGLENRGLEAFLRDNVPALAECPVPVVANAGGESVEEFEAMVAALDEVACIRAIELNLSCPNVQEGRLPFASEPEAVAEVVSRVRGLTRKPLWAKLSPNVTRIAPLARAAEEAGANALTVSNTLLGLVVDWEARRPVLGAGFGGLSGPAVRPVVVRLVWETRQAVDLPIVASGGVATADDVLEYLVAGASAVQVGTLSFRKPDVVSRIAADLRERLTSRNLSVSGLVGTLQWPDPAEPAFLGARGEG